MPDSLLVGSILLPVMFGLFGLIEPCSIGTTLVMIKRIEGRSGRAQVLQIVIFAATRAIVIGLLGVVAAWIGSALTHGVPSGLGPRARQTTMGRGDEHLR